MSTALTARERMLGRLRAAAHGHLRAAFQRRDIAPGLGQHARGGRDMRFLPVMGGAGQRDFGRRQRVLVCRPGLDQGQRLQRLDG